MVWLLGLWDFIVNNAPALVGIILPPFVQWANKDIVNEMERFWMTILVCLVATILLHWKEVAATDPAHIAMWFTVIFTESQVVYRLYFKNSRIQTLITKAGGNIPVQPVPTVEPQP